MLLVDDLGQLASVDHLLVDVHANFIFERIEFADIATDDLCDGRTPSSKRKRALVGLAFVGNVLPISTAHNGNTLECLAHLKCKRS